MNRSCADFERYYSNVGIMPILSADSAVVAQLPKKRSFAASRALSILRSLSGSAALRWAKVAGVALALIALLGIAGAVEYGKLSILGGAAFAALTVGIEYLCLRNIGR